MKEISSFDSELPADIYRSYLMLTCAWSGTRALPGSLIVKDHAGGDQAPIFLCGGPPECGPFFKEILGKDRSIFRMRGTYGALPPTNDIVSSLAKYYASEMIKIYPQGPYHLVGYCEAALVTFEIAQVLVERGYKIGQLVLIERDSTDEYLLISLGRKVFSLMDRLAFHYHELQQLEATEGLKYLIRKSSRKIDGNSSTVTGIKNAGIQKYNRDGAMQTKASLYKCRPYNGNLALIYIRWGMFGFFQFKFFQKYWEKIAAGGAVFRLVSGNTHSYPNWKEITDVVRDLLEASGDSAIVR